LNIRGYPTVKFYKKGGATPEILDYNSARTVEAFEQFIKENTRYFTDINEHFFLVIHGSN